MITLERQSSPISSGGCKVPETAVADTGPILHLSEIGEAGQLSLFNAVIVSHLVKMELVHLHAWPQAAGTLSNCLRVERVSAREINEQARALSAYTVHRADLSTAALAARVRPDIVLTDDLRLRRGLEGHGHQVMGSIAVLLRAFHTGRLTKSDLLVRLDQLLDGSTLYTSKAFRKSVRSALKGFPG